VQAIKKIKIKKKKNQKERCLNPILGGRKRLVVGQEGRAPSSQPSAPEYFPSANAGSRFRLGGLMAEPSWAKSWAGLAQGTSEAKADIPA